MNGKRGGSCPHPGAAARGDAAAPGNATAAAAAARHDGSSDCAFLALPWAHCAETFSIVHGAAARRFGAVLLRRYVLAAL